MLRGRWLTVLLASAVVLIGFAGNSAQAQLIKFDGCGLLVASPECHVLFQPAGSYEQYVLDSTSSFVAGDTVHVVGMIDPVCFTLCMSGCIHSNTISHCSNACACLNQGDVNGDGAIDVFDIIAMIGIVFSGDPDFQDPWCPTTLSDVNNDRNVDVFDVIYLIETAFSGGPNPVNPCGP